MRQRMWPNFVTITSEPRIPAGAPTATSCRSGTPATNSTSRPSPPTNSAVPKSGAAAIRAQTRPMASRQGRVSRRKSSCLRRARATASPRGRSSFAISEGCTCTPPKRIQRLTLRTDTPMPGVSAPASSSAQPSSIHGSQRASLR